MWDFIKKFRKGAPKEVSAPAHAPTIEKPAQETKPVPPSFAPALSPGASKGHGSAELLLSEAGPAAPVEKPHAQKTDDELAEELNKISPEILSQAKTPQMRKLVIDLYRRMLVEGVDVNNEKEVKKWLKKHPEAVNGGEAHKIETFKRGEPKVGRNDACPCGSGRKYKKCCGQGKK